MNEPIIRMHLHEQHVLRSVIDRVHLQTTIASAKGALSMMTATQSLPGSANAVVEQRTERLKRQLKTLSREQFFLDYPLASWVIGSDGELRLDNDAEVLFILKCT